MKFFRLRWLREIGMVQRTLKRWMEDKPNCESASADFQSVGMKEILPLFTFYFYALLASALIGIIEILVHPKSWMKRRFLGKNLDKSAEQFSYADSFSPESQSQVSFSPESGCATEKVENSGELRKKSNGGLIFVEYFN